MPNVTSRPHPRDAWRPCPPPENAARGASADPSSAPDPGPRVALGWKGRRL